MPHGSGPPQKEIFEESKHGIAFFANIQKMNLDHAKRIVGEDYFSAPTCATCHLSATRKHDIGLRISWTNRPALSVRPEVADAKMKLPGKDVPWPKRRAGTVDVCRSSQDKGWVDNWNVQHDELVKL